MNRIFSWLVLLFLAVSFATQSVAGKSSPEESAAVVHLKLSDLRSAYLLRAGAVRYDATQATPDGIRAQLQRHFDTVIGLLLVSTQTSIEVALARLEATDDHAWSDIERASWRAQLLSSRYLQLQRLAFYRDRGRFPQNEGQSLEPAPVFVDAHDTACAVGQLMRWSGWLKTVAHIHDSNNLIYVPEALSTPVASWVLTSGITLEEAALVQPGYLLVATNSTADYGPGGSAFVKDGLKYQNFQISAGNYILTPGFTFHQALDIDPINGIVIPALSGPLPASAFAFNAGSNAIPNPFPPGIDNTDPPGNRWLLFGGASSLSFAQPCPCAPIGGSTQTGSVQKITVSFDVSTIDPNTFIDQFAEFSNPSYSGFHLSASSNNNDGQYEFTTTFKHLGNVLGTTSFQEPPSGSFFTQTSSAMPPSKTDSLSVTSTIWLYNGATLDSFVLGFNLVPEPGSVLLAIIGLAGVTFRRSSRFR